MGRILEALRREANRGPSTPDAAPPRPRLDPPKTDTADDLAGESVPFIEVGGPRSQLEASPDVLACPSPRRGPAAPPPAAAPRLRPVAAPPDEPRVMTVAFRPLAGEPLRGPAHRGFTPELIAYHRPDHPVSEQYRRLATGIAAQLPTGRPQVVLFTAMAPGAGTTTVLLNTAVAWAGRRARVAVVDANVCRPAVGERLGLRPAPGLRELLTGEKDVARVVQETGIPNLGAVSVGRALVGRSAGGEWHAALRQLREQFDVVLVDAPCWDGRSGIAALGSACDAVYLVLPEAEADGPAAGEMVRRIPEQGGRLRGLILTQR